MKFIFTPVLFFIGLCFFAGEVFGQSAPFPRFDLIGDGKIKIKNIRSGVSADVSYVDGAGLVNHEASNKIDVVFSFPTREMGENISSRLVAYLDYFSDKVAPGQWIALNSGYRSPDDNEALRKSGRGAARTSTHMDGMAIDITIDGVEGLELWKFVREHNCCGVGHYGGKVVHLDVGRPRFWQQHTSKVNTDESAYNRSISLSPEYDRYRVGERARLLLNSVSDYGFEVNEELEIISGEAQSERFVKGVKLQPPLGEGKCHPIANHKESRFLYFSLPSQLSGNYRIRLKFCKKPFPEMPDFVVSRSFSVFPTF